jgi:hypothetical protein
MAKNVAMMAMIGATSPTPENCRQMIPFRSRSDSWTFTPEQRAIGIETNFSRCPYIRTHSSTNGWKIMSIARRDSAAVDHPI